MLGLRQNLRILTPERHALFLLSNRLCRHQHESFKGEEKKKPHVGGGDKSLLPVPPLKNKDNITKRRKKLSASKASIQNAAEALRRSSGLQ